MVGVRRNPIMDMTTAADINSVTAVFAALFSTLSRPWAIYFAMTTLAPTPKPETNISITFMTGPLTETPVMPSVPINFPAKYISTAL